MGSIPIPGTNRINNLDRFNPRRKTGKKGSAVIVLSRMVKKIGRLESEPVLLTWGREDVAISAESKHSEARAHSALPYDVGFSARM